jgi:serine/threonine protein kinase
MLEAGQVLHDRYQLKQKLGQNAGRQTWLAEDLQAIPAKLVIVKLLAFGGEVQWDDLKLFEREAQVLKQLNHSRIPKYYDYFSVDERSLWFGLVQEFIPGASLKELLNQGKRFTEKQVRQVAINVLNILIYLHELKPQVLHRDIKPSNLILGEDKQVYLVDFGAVQDRAVKEGATFTVVGTYGYAPMEQFGGRAVPASDLYALGASLIHLLTGTAPADLPQDDLRIQFSDKVTLTPRFREWLEKLTEPSLKRRFSTAKEALKTLNFGIQTPKNAALSAPVSTGRIRPPFGTRVQVSQSLEQLQIVIPERSPSDKQGLALLGSYVTFALVSILWIATNVGMPVIAFPFLVAFLISSIKHIEFRHKRTQVDFNRNTNCFKLQKQWFGYVIARYKGSVSDIMYTCCYSSKEGAKVLITGIEPYSFGYGLTELECAWLAQEIQSWLNLK